MYYLLIRKYIYYLRKYFMLFLIFSFIGVLGEGWIKLFVGFVRVILDIMVIVYSCLDIRLLDILYWFIFFISGFDELNEFFKNF